MVSIGPTSFLAFCLTFSLVSILLYWALLLAGRQTPKYKGTACLSVCLPAYLSFHISACLPACLFVCMPACLSVSLPSCVPALLALPEFLSLCLPVYLSTLCTRLADVAFIFVSRSTPICLPRVPALLMLPVFLSLPTCLPCVPALLTLPVFLSLPTCLPCLVVVLMMTLVVFSG